MRSYFVAIGCVLLFSLHCLPAEIKVKPQIEPYSLVDVSTDEAGTGYAWFVLGPRRMERWVSTDTLNQSIVFTGPPGRYTIMMVVQTEGGGLDQGFAEVFIGEIPEPPIPPPPDPGDDPDYAALAITWLASVAKDARDDVIENPVSGEKMTRQQAVGKTLSQIGAVAKSLGSIRAINTMLTTGLIPAFGDKAEQWKSFSISVDGVLAALEKRKVTPEEYGKVLSAIGGALQ